MIPFSVQLNISLNNNIHSLFWLWKVMKKPKRLPKSNLKFQIASIAWGKISFNCLEFSFGCESLYSLYVGMWDPLALVRAGVLWVDMVPLPFWVSPTKVCQNAGTENYFHPREERKQCWKIMTFIVTKVVILSVLGSEVTLVSWELVTLWYLWGKELFLNVTCYWIDE